MNLYRLHTNKESLYGWGRTFCTTDEDGDEHWSDPQGRSHRHNGPSMTITVPHFETTTYIWAIHGQRHRVDGPATIKVKNGVTVSEWWYCFDKQIGEVNTATGTYTVYGAESGPAATTFHGEERKVLDAMMAAHPNADWFWIYGE